MGAGRDDVAGILVFVKFNKPLTQGSAFLITLNGSHMRGARLLVGRNQDSQEQLVVDCGGCGSFPTPRCRQGYRLSVPDSGGGLTIDHTCKHGRAGGRALSFTLEKV